ncbi:epithelial-stromal interaction protein 1 isoform X2 [Phyllopteryx taeniolatus]|uniref:epithelial-stromal interaction protein 1 isoform X2 n=1 Tax=Phyllopteryx taeniolatus TaxID=161469 RepID=UPI002AD2F47C|nr:epithelial-stromal interaction protein 1 isoform X2 [Phyllopteryx taeniolatus]
MDPNGHEVKHCSNANNPTRDPIDNNMATRTKYLGGVTVISPIESRRNEMRMMAEKEEEELQKLKEALRLTHVHTTPQRLGGDATLAQVRERQSADLRCSKMQKKLKQETLAQKKRKEEEDELQWKKDEHRKKAERLEERKKAEQQRRREDLQQDHAQVNSAFLDKLDRPSGGSVGNPTSESGTRGQERPGPRPGDDDSGEAEETDQDQDEYQERYRYQNLEWALMKLMVNFPDFSRLFLEDILDQCSGDYRQAHALLKRSMT